MSADHVSRAAVLLLVPAATAAFAVVWPVWFAAAVVGVAVIAAAGVATLLGRVPAARPVPVRARTHR